MLLSQKMIQDQEFKNDKLKLQIETLVRKLILKFFFVFTLSFLNYIIYNNQEANIRNLQKDNINLNDECETLRANETKLQRKLKDAEVSNKVFERDALCVKQKEREIEVMQSRLR